ncbi:MAG: pantoate--beta-alanine ligase [Balneolaceae bacterium]
MLVTKSIDEIRSAVKLWKRQKLTVGFVPTMGALHEGHLALIQKARKHSDRVVVSIYVNPEQFRPDEDYEKYPRNLDDDLKLCRDYRAAAVFTPEDSVMYPKEEKYLGIGINELNSHMCGASRPGFFEGVVLVVNKLFNIIEPDLAVFGQKDIQQFRIVEEMVREFNHSTELVMGEIERANDGLALSSRNAYLSNEERLKAPSVYRALSYLEKQIHDGVDEPSLLIRHQQNELEAKGFKIDYLGVFSLDKLQPVEKLENKGNYIIAAAVYLGETRLIDNILIENEQVI